jgi:hypothetical protein
VKYEAGEGWDQKRAGATLAAGWRLVIANTDAHVRCHRRCSTYVRFVVRYENKAVQILHMFVIV